MVHAKTLGFMKRNQHAGKEKFVLFLQRQCESVDNGPENLKQLCDAVETLGFVGELEEDIVDGAAYV